MILNRRAGAHTLFALLSLCALFATSGCLEQLQSTRIPAGALNNFLIHLQNGELDDARTYFAPGLVAPSSQLDASIESASERVKPFEFRRIKSTAEDLANGEKRVTLSGQMRSRTRPGDTPPAPEEGWADTQIITARMVERGPGWRLLDFELLCCR